MSKNDNAFVVLERFSQIVEQKVALMRERDPAVAMQLKIGSAPPPILLKIGSAPPPILLKIGSAPPPILGENKSAVGRFGSSVNIGMGLTAVLSSGWNASEAWGSWSEGDRASLRLSIPPDCAFPIDVFLTLIAYLNESGEQRISISVGSRRVRSFSFRESKSTRSIVLTLRGSDVSEGYVDLLLRVHYPISPIKQGRSKDVRRLGIGLISIGTKPVTVPQPDSVSIRRFRSFRAIGDRLTGGGLQALGNRLTGDGIRAMGRRITERWHVFIRDWKD
jgi:hypothetical protein